MLPAQAVVLTATTLLLSSLLSEFLHALVLLRTRTSLVEVAPLDKDRLMVGNSEGREEDIEKKKIDGAHIPCAVLEGDRNVTAKRMLGGGRGVES